MKGKLPFSPRDEMVFWSWINRSERMRRCSASAGGKPRSRKTFPVDRVIFTLTGGLPAFLRPLFQKWVFGSQTLTVPSQLLEANAVPSGLKARLVMRLV